MLIQKAVVMVPEKQYLLLPLNQDLDLHHILTYLFLLCILHSTYAQSELSVEQQIERASSLLDSARYDEALNMALPLQEQIIALNSKLPLQIRYFNLLGYCYLDKRDFENALHPFEKARTILQFSGDTTSLLYAQTLNNLGNYYFQIGSFDNSLLLNKQALDIRLKQRGKEHPDTADSFNNIANCYLVSGKYEEALDYYQEALGIRQNYWQESHPDIASVLNNMGNTFLSMGAPLDAVEYYRRALNMREKLLGSTHLKTIDGYQNLGNAYFSANQLDSALLFTQLSLESFQTHYPDQQIRIASLYNNLGNISTEKRNFDQAQRYLHAALDIQQNLLEEDHLSIADTYQNMGDAFYENTDYKQALLFFRRANGIYKIRLEKRHPLVANVWEKIGLCLKYLGDLELAENAHDRAKSIREEFFGPNHIYLAGTYTNIGNCLWKRDNPESAIKQYKKALAIWERQPDIPPIELNKLYNNIGNCYFHLQDYSNALSYYEKARHFSSEENLLSAMTYHKHKGVVFGQQKQFEEAIESFDEGLRLLAAYPLDIAPIEALLLLDASAKNFLNYYRVNRSYTTLYKAYLTYQQAIKLMDQLWQGYLTADSRQKINDTRFPLFEGAIESCFELWQKSDSLAYLEEAFLFSEKSKSSRLLNAVRLNQSAQMTNIPVEYAFQLQELKSKIAYHEKLRYELFKQRSSDFDEVLVEDRLILQLKTQRDSINLALQKKFPSYRRLMSNQELETISSTQKKLAGSKKKMIVFFSGEKNIYAFVIESEKVSAHQISLDFDLERLLENLGHSIIQYPASGSQDARRLDSIYVDCARQLYQKIWQPLKIAPDQERTVTVIADRFLSYLPFEVLLTNAPASSQRYRSYPFLLKDFNISYAYSATLLAETQARDKTRAPRKWLGVAPSFENHQLGLSPLEHNQSEVNVIQKLIGGDIMAGSDANLDHFLQLAPKYRWLHLATHAVADDTKGQLPFLAFAQSPDSTATLQLFADDLFHKNFPAELVVLSACETGFGQAHPSEGIASLARSFSYAGAKSVITTLWSINDAKTALFMEDFYKKLKKGIPKDQALWESKIQFVESSAHEYAHPFFWAAYTPIGDMSSIRRGNSWGRWSLITLVLIGCLVYLKRAKNLF